MEKCERIERFVPEIIKEWKMGPMRKAVQVRLQRAKPHLITSSMCIHSFMTSFLQSTEHGEISLNSSMQDWLDGKENI